MRIYTFLFVLCCISFLSQAQNVTLSGYVRDAANGETLIGATVFLSEISKGTSANEYGFYSIYVEPGTYTLVCSYVGFADQELSVELLENKTLNFDLAEESDVLEEVVVTAENENRNVEDVQMSVERLDIDVINRIPRLFGEADVLRSIQLLPGVTTVGEGAAGFNVRGGSIDQNLVILDEAPVYNSSHLFGFFSVFNPDAVKGVQLYKGGIPARYGGRLSSILDVRMKEGNSKKLQMQGGIGTIFSRLSVEAPIVKDKASFLVAGRRSYIDLLAQPFLDDDLEGTALNFYDLTLKTNYRSGEKNQFFLSGYFGRDNFRFGEAAGFSWGNTTATFRWNHLFNTRLFSNVTAFFSDYDYNIEFGDEEEDTFDWDASIRNFSIKPEFSYFISPDNILRFGGQSTYYEFEPANAIAVSNSEEIDISLQKQFALESGVFVENEIRPGRFTINYGLRLSHFAYLGERNVYEYGEAPQLGEEKPLTNVSRADDNEVIESWFNLEPRLAVQMRLNSESSLKASYNRTVQYIHLLSNTTASVPVDIWTPSTNNIDPQRADQVAVGYFRNFKDNTYELSSELYYKKFYNLIDYIDGADLLLNELVEGQVLSGEGRAYGLEIQVKKNKGRLTGWLSYTLARSERLIEGISNNEWYPSRFDQTHNLNLTGFYDLNQRLTLSASFVYNTGTPISLPSSGYYVQGYYIPHITSNERNNLRIPDFHRLDVSVTLGPKPENKNKSWQGEWVFSVYNLYARRNAFTIYGDQGDERVAVGSPVDAAAIRLSVIGSLIPSVSYNFTFK